MSLPAVQSARSMPGPGKPLSLLAGWPVSLRRVLGQLQRLAELLLGEQFMRLHVLKGAHARDRDAQRGADRVGDIGDDDPVVGPEHPVTDSSEPPRESSNCRIAAVRSPGVLIIRAQVPLV